jgi:hypothetical protein
MGAVDRKQELLEVERSRWREFRDLIDRIPSDRMEEPTLNAEGWSVKDLLWHMRCWNVVIADQLAKIDAGTFEDFDWNTEENNTRFLDEGRRMDPITVQAELVVSREHAVRAMAAMMEVPPRAEELFSETAFKHMDDHLPELHRYADRVAGAA